MARQRFTDWIVSKLPPLLQAPRFQAFVRSMGDSIDAAEQRADQAIKQRMPAYAGNAALEVIGWERSLPRYATETKAAYAARLKKAFSLWKLGGTPLGLLRALTNMGYPNVHILTARGQDHSLDGSQNLVTVVGAPLTLPNPGWNHFLVVFRTTLVTPWQTTIPASSSDEANQIRRVIRRWKWGNAAFDGVLIQAAGSLWGYPSTLVWGAGGLTWGSSWIYWPPVDGLTWGYPTSLTWGQALLKWGVPAPSTEE